MSTKSLLKSTGIISAGTAASRALGFVRLVIVANFFGTGNPIQAFIVAFRIPNLLRDLVAEGAMNSAFVPVLSEYLATKDRNEYNRLCSTLLVFLSIVLSAVVLAGIAAAPLIVRVIAPGFIAFSPQLRLTIALTRMMFPYILLMGFAAYAMGVLNSLKHFSAPAFAPVFLNISLISAMLIFRRSVDVAVLAAAVLAGGVLHILVQLPALRANGFRFETPRTLGHPGVRKIIKLLVPRAFGSAVYHVNVFVDTMLSSLSKIVGAGGIAALNYSYILIQLPTAVFGTSLATAGLPTLSEHFAKNDMERYKNTLNVLLKSLFLIMVPATVGIMVLGVHIVRILFQRGEFTHYSTMITSQALFFYAIGLFSYAGIKILVSCFYSMHDTMTPVKTAAAALGVNVVFNLILMWPMKIGGLALATSISGIFNFTVLYGILRKRIGSFAERYIFVFLGKVALAAAVMGGLLYAGVTAYEELLLQKNILFNAAFLALGITAAFLAYFLTLYLLRLKEMGKFVTWILRIG